MRMGLFHFVRAAIGLVMALSSPALWAAAAGDCDAFRGDERTLPGELLPEDARGWRSMALPASADLDEALARLDYGDELPLVYGVDLDGDGERELFLASPGGRLCGNAGCPYVLLAGKPSKRIAEVFGHLAILDERIDGHRILQTYSRSVADATNLDTWVFDGDAYRLASHVIVDRCGLEQWSRRMRKAE